MSNQALAWSMFFLPWLTILLMKRADIKRYMPVAMFATVISTIIHDVGLTLGFWTIGERIFPLNQTMPYLYGSMPVLTLWVFKFTYGRFWLYLATNLILDIGFNFFFLNVFLPGRGILVLLASPVRALPITLIHAIVIYGYQMWQEGIFARPERTGFVANLQPAAAKPLPEEEDGRD